MSINKIIFRLWIMNKINELDNKVKLGLFSTVEEACKAQGRLDVLKELYDDYNLDDVSKEELIYHDQI